MLEHEVGTQERGRGDESEVVGNRGVWLVCLAAIAIGVAVGVGVSLWLTLWLLDQLLLKQIL